MTIKNMRNWLNALQANPLRFVVQMQGVDEETLTNYRAETLETAAGVHKFLRVHNLQGDNEKLRAFALGLIFGLAADDNMKQQAVAGDLQSIIGMLTTLNINIFTGEPLHEETDPGPVDSADNN